MMVTDKYKAQKASREIWDVLFFLSVILALDKNNNVVSTSKVIHIATKGGKVKNHTGLKLNSAARLTIKGGKTSKIKAKALGKGVKKHVALRYERSNTAVAAVTRTGKVKALKAGTCKVYVYTQNGKIKTVKVTGRK